MRKIYFILFSVMYVTTVSSQAFQWAKNVTSNIYPAFDYWSYSLCLDNNGCVYVTGCFQGTADFDPGPGIHNLTAINASKDVYVVKLDNGGNFIWAKRVGGINQDIGTNVKWDSAGGICITGQFGSIVDFDPGPGVQNINTNGIANLFVLKLDTAGNFIWAKCIAEGPINKAARGLAIDGDKNVYTIGRYQGTVDFDPGANIFNLSSVGNLPDIFISKIDSVGNLVWAQTYGDSASEDVWDIAIDINNDVLITGEFGDTVDFDNGPAVCNLTGFASETFILKLNQSGNLIWAKNLGSTSNDVGNGITSDNVGNIYVFGKFKDSADFDLGPNVYNLYTSAIQHELYVLKLDGLGNFIMAKSFEGNGMTATDIKVDNGGGVFLLGYFNYFMDMDPGPNVYNMYVTGGGMDFFLVKLDVSGNYQWGKNFGGSFPDYAMEIAIDNIGGVYGTGQFEDTVDFDPGPNIYNLVCNGGEDAFVFKYNYCGVNYYVNYTACDSIVLFGNTYDTTGVYVQQLMNALGCDSNLIMQVTINEASYGALSDISCGSYLFYGQTYNATGVYLQAIPNAVGCDSIITLTLTILPINLGVTQNGLTFTANAIGVSYQWIKCNPYQIISGEVNQTFTAIQNGDYAVIISGAECSDTSVCFNVHNVGLDDFQQFSNIVFFPNPVTERLTIESETIFQNAHVKLYNVIGQEVANKNNISGSKAEIDMLKLTTGIYFIEIKDDRCKYVKVVTKK